KYSDQLPPRPMEPGRQHQVGLAEHRIQPKLAMGRPEAGFGQHAAEFGRVKVRLTNVKDLRLFAHANPLTKID
ncbi:hypothetical protein, partial [Mesorhizobium sp.]|uniref:hypothetical protein n=1 Tax=Mesorhizobium sp. TaxID=1871066 RepID=UPI0025C0277D